MKYLALAFPWHVYKLNWHLTLAANTSVFLTKKLKLYLPIFFVKGFLTLIGMARKADVFKFLKAFGPVLSTKVPNFLGTASMTDSDNR